MSRPASAAQMLVDIHAWLPAYDEAVAWAQRSASVIPAGGERAPEGRVPFRLSARLDSLDDGMPGALTSAGINTIFSGWADHVAAARGEPRTTAPVIYLAATSHWWAAEYSDAEALLDDIVTAWGRIAAATGHQDQADTTHRCPSCGGVLVRASTPRGLSDWRTCTVCDAWYPDESVVEAVRRHSIASPLTCGDSWVTRREALSLHANTLSSDCLRQWIRRGHVRTRGRDVSLNDINRRLQNRKRQSTN